MKNILDKRLLIISGKGGTGKTTISLAIAKKAAFLGKTVCIVQSNPGHSIKDMFQIPRTHINEEMELFHNVYALNINKKIVIREYLLHILGREKIYRPLLENRFVSSFFNAIPYLEEILILGRLYWMIESIRPENYSMYDLVIYDAPSSGHNVNILSTPFIMKEAISRGILSEHIDKIIQLLNDKSKTSLILLSIPERLAIQECLETYEAVNNQNLLNRPEIILNMVSPFQNKKNIVEKLLNDNYYLEKIANDPNNFANYSLSLIRQRINNTLDYSYELEQFTGNEIIKVPYIQKDEENYEELIDRIANNF